MSYYLGLDAGGTKTYSVIVDETGRVVGRGRSGLGNHQTNRPRAEQNIRLAVDLALQDAQLQKVDIDFAYFGLAGADREPDFTILRPIIAGLGFSKYEIACDTIIAMRAGTSRPFGVVVICGTGTNCSGMNRQGENYQCGGFSYMFGDYGGGGVLAVEAFRSVIREWDGRGRPTLLTKLVLQRLGYSTTEAMFHDFLDHGKRVPSDLAELLFEASAQGDEVALDLLRYQGEELGRSVQAVVRRLRLEQEELDVVLAGSVLTRGQGDYVIRHIAGMAVESAPRSHVRKLDCEPLVGALLLAMERDGRSIEPDIQQRLKQIQMEPRE
ncbi:Glucosamine kinase GspK [Paenibacillus larvae subsp. larvae]|uniref:Glucosamine kinase GspK n=2 Tax=Paenibacillus larvae TaxID=1464 RepID=A0A2L1U5N6_9BACL|nr:BadF/BadG/BcrA/BcrD ATPase family protein [Paenibacillus larvae]AVF28245.1 Glucosamine kinase GspK [Paenibacillus larvae subsp. larvae]AVF32748.1 Glucosamine kinase GspK [Paenibacillus larvae subsp. larvae]MBH0341714.1 ATPase [Paenibacillus larvae]MCY7520715.1 ATPase [Paenibacillus larvae]MCY9500521.1 ATPase [Paenibacillus larvae]